MPDRGDSEWVDRSPRQSKAMKAAYKGLADALEYVAQCHADGDWDSHHEAISIMIDWEAEIGRVAAIETARRNTR